MSRVKLVARGPRKKRTRQQAQRPVPVANPQGRRGRLAFLSQRASNLFVPLSLTIITALPILLSNKLWLAIWRGNLSRAWDGAGHSALAQIYTESVFPDTFGWTNAYFAGMPLPNFYPPVFYWFVALLHHTHLLSFAAAFKLTVVLPVLLTPAAMWLLGWSLSNRNRLFATGVALASVLLLIDVRFMGALLAGLDNFSTFQIGLYTQPLGFILLIGWFIVYTQAHRSSWKFVLSALLLALTVLANFFNATTAAVLILSTVIFDLIDYQRTADLEEKQECRSALLAHSLAPVVAFGLTLFWFVPVVNEYGYFVTRPYIVSTEALFTPALFAWFAVALVGSILWLRRTYRRTALADNIPFGSRRVVWSYLAACAILAGAVLCASIATPGWFPLQTPRFLATLSFMLAVPVGYSLASGFRRLASLLDKARVKSGQISFKQARYSTALTFALFLMIALSAPALSWAYAFYPAEKRKEIEVVMEFARQRRDGRYLVEVINPKKGPAWTEASFDARALNSYLGAQGNETISGVFHEASANVLFTLPTVNAFSNYPDSFGISSVLADDLDFVAQPLEQHIIRARFLGVRYLVIRTPAMKERLGKATGIAARHDFGWWSVYELGEAPRPPLNALTYKPALVVSSFTVKARRRNEMSFIRLAEEQFADAWFEVVLARSPQLKLDRLMNLDNFGALVVDTYDYDDETKAFQRLRDFSQHHSLVLLASDAGLFQRIKATAAEFPKLQIIERSPERPGEIIEALAPSYHYNSNSVRQQWLAIRRILESNKEAVEATAGLVKGRIEDRHIAIDYDSGLQAGKIPVLISTTFHPNWRRGDGEAIYGATPFYMLTFVDSPVQIDFERERLDRIALWISGATAVFLGIFVAWLTFRSVASRIGTIVQPH